MITVKDNDIIERTHILKYGKEQEATKSKHQFVEAISKLRDKY